MNKDGKLYNAAAIEYTNENSGNGNQKATSEYGVSFKQKSPTLSPYRKAFARFYLVAVYCYSTNSPQG